MQDQAQWPDEPAEEVTAAFDAGEKGVTDPPAPPKKSSPKWIILFLAALAMAAVAIIVVANQSGSDDDPVTAAASDGDDQSPLEEAAEVCSSTPGAMEATDDGRTLIVDTEGEESGSGELTIFDFICVTGMLAMPDSVFEHVQSTRALDGMQTNTWDHYEARWTYHPDSGLDITITDSED